MLGHVAAFELRYQLRGAVFRVGCLIFFLLTFAAVTAPNVNIGGSSNAFVNAPYQILQTLAIMAVFGVFVMVGLVANSVVRDDDTGFAPLVRSSSVTKSAYLVGRFLGSATACFLVLAVVPLAMLVGSQMPWLDPEKVGPLRLEHYLYALVVFALPTLLVVSSMFFSLATLTRSLVASYVGAVALVMLYLTLLNWADGPEYDYWVALLDPFALGSLSVVTKYWTVHERNTALPALAGVFLHNRLLWSAVSLALFALTYRAFRFEQGGRAARGPAPADEARPIAAFADRLPEPRAGARTLLAQLGAVARFDMAFVFRSPAFLVLVAIAVLNSIGSMWNEGEILGGNVKPVTRLMVEALRGSFTFFPWIVAIYYGGELVWRDRQQRMHELVGATAAPDWVRLAPKIAAVVLVLGATFAVGVASGIGVQALRGYTSFELASYVLWYLLPATAVAALLGILSVFVQVLVPQKMLGWGVMLLQIAALIALPNTGLEHNLYNYAQAPDVPLSDMNGTGRFWIAQAWFLAYWSAFAGLLCIAAYALWPRGAGDTLRARLRWVPRRLPETARAAFAGILVTWLGLLAFLYYNTNVLNEYLPRPDAETRLAAYERDLMHFETTPQPRITHVTLAVEIAPHDVRVRTRGTYRIENKTREPLREVHVAWDPRLRLDSLEVTGASLEEELGRHHYRVYRFGPRLQPGETREISFDTTLEERGFPNSRPLVRIVANGTFLNNREIAPWLGISRDGVLRDRSTRYKHGLPRELRPAKLEDDAARAHNALSRDSDWVISDITVTTDGDQTPVAPGDLVADRVENGRRRARFVVSAPINNLFSIQSARYERRTRQHNGVELSVYFHPGHPDNVERMLDAMAKSLDMYRARFSPYQFAHARILEFPAYASFAQAYAGTMPYSEGIGFIADHAQDPARIDLVTYVTAHEVAHQWWGHQVISSDQQGAALLTESFAQYSALLVMEEMYGRDQVRRFLKYELDRYLRSRGADPIEELPLARVESQPYIYYQKGTLALYWLREMVGEATVNRALARLLREFAFRPAPYPNPRDFLRLLRAEAGPEHEALIADLFEKITLYDVRVAQANAEPLPDGRWRVTLDVEARKLYADGQGVETEAPLAEPFEIGVFARGPEAADFGPADVLHFERRELKSGRQSFALEVAARPAWVGVDPYNKRIDRNSEDNLLELD